MRSHTSPAHYSISAARFCKDDLQPISLSSGRMPAGMSWHSMVISVPSSVSAKLVVIFISPANPGSSDSNSMTSTILSSAPIRQTGHGRYPRRSKSCHPANALWVLVGQRHSERAALACVEDVHMTLHAIRRSPCGQRLRIEAGPIRGLPRRFHKPRTCVFANVAGASAMSPISTMIAERYLSVSGSVFVQTFRPPEYSRATRNDNAPAPKVPCETSG